MGKEVIREELVRPYVHHPIQGSNNKVSDFASQNMPMVAMFLRNKPIAWSAMFLAIQSYLNEPLIKDPSDSSQMGIMKVVFAVVALLTSYMDLVFPNAGPAAKKAAATATATAVTAAATATAAAVSAATSS